MNIISRISVLPILLFMSSFAIAFSEELPVYSLKYDKKSNPFDDGRKALKLAKETNRRVLIEVGGDWCMYCHLLDRFIQSNPEIKQRLYRTFVVLKVNYSDENKNRKFLSGFERIRGYPHLFITENNGKVIYSNDMKDIMIEGKLSKTKMFEFLDKWKIKNTKS